MVTRHTIAKKNKNNQDITSKCGKIGKNIFQKTSHKIMKVNIFCGPEEAMLHNWWKLVFNWKNILFFEKIEPSSAVKMLQKRMRNIHV